MVNSTVLWLGLAIAVNHNLSYTCMLNSADMTMAGQNGAYMLLC